MNRCLTPLVSDSRQVQARTAFRHQRYVWIAPPTWPRLAGWWIVGDINKPLHVHVLNSFWWGTAALGCSSVHPINPPHCRPTLPILPPSSRFALSKPAVRMPAVQSIRHPEMQILHTSLVLMEIESSFKPPPCHVEPLPAALPIVSFFFSSPCFFFFSQSRIRARRPVRVRFVGGAERWVIIFQLVLFWRKREQHKAATAVVGVERMGWRTVKFFFFFVNSCWTCEPCAMGFCRNMRVM